MASPVKGIPVAPLTGLLDIRSLPDLLPPGALRWRQNLQTTGEGKIRRGCGWTKALSQSPYNNQDFHDQLLLFGGTVREPVTGLFEFETARGIRSLWLTTQSRIAKLNETTGNWKIIASGLGGGAGTDCSGPRFKASNVGDYVWFTNGHDRPKIHRLEQPPFDSVLIADSPDLEAIGLTKAALTWAWKDVVFFADVEMDGQRFGNRIVWGDFKNPSSVDPSKPESIAGFMDLDYGERILSGGPTTAGTYLLYTTRAIWELFADPVRAFDKRQVYDGKKADYVGVLKYQNTLVDIGGDHLYLAKDGLYAFNPYRSAPELVTWLHRATSVLFDDIDESACAGSIGWFHDGEAFWSVKRNSDTGCPGVTLRVETQFKVADTIDHGFTAAVSFRPQPIPTIRDFILDYRICTLPCLTASLIGNELPPPFENEGLPSPFAEPTAPFVPLYFYTSVTQTIDGVVTEDWNQPSPSSDSLCALLGDITIDDLCQGCEAVSVLIAASSQDWCLKQFGGFYRERLVNPTDVGTSVECDETCVETPAECVGVDPLAIVTTELPGGVEGEAYSLQMEASGGSGNYLWEITSGTLPDGLTMSTSGLISGTPTGAADVELGFSVSDTLCVLADATASLTITVTTTGDPCGPKPPVSLLAYYNCNDVAYPVIDSVAGKNLTYILGDPFPSVEAGIIGTGFFNGAGGFPRFEMGNTDAQWELTGEEAFTIRAWFWYSGDYSTVSTVSVGVQGRVLIQMFDPLLGPYFKFVVQASEDFTHSHYAAIGEPGWHRVVATFRKHCGTVLKVDNNESNFFPFENPLEVWAGGNTFILENGTENPGVPKAGIDEVGIWLGAWTEEQMLDDWNSGLGKTYPNVPDGPNLFVDNLAAYYACEETGASTFLADSTGNHNVPTYGSGSVLTAAGIIGTAIQMPPGSANPKFRMASSGPWGDFSGRDFAVRLWVYMDVSLGNVFVQGPNWYIEHANDVVRFHVDGDPSGSYTILSGSVTGAAWHRVVVWHRTGIELGMKIDNDANITPVPAANPLVPGNGRFAVSDVNAITDTRIDEIAIWDGYIPTEFELLNDWNGGAGRTYPLT